MNKIKLAVLPGDGIGQDVTYSAIPVFEALNIPVELNFSDIGWEYWKRQGNPVPDKTWEIIKSCDATLLGATTSKPEKEALKELPIDMQSSPPQYVSPIVQLRQQLDLYANVRPCFNVKNDGENFEFSIIRENTEGLYSGLDFYPMSDELSSIINRNTRWKHITNQDASCSIRLQTRQGLTRLFEFTFQYADRKKINKITLADKPNVLRKSGSFAREIFESIANNYPHIQAEIHNVDAIALWMVKRPYDFGVIVAENMFGDILSDLGAGIMGGLGFAPSANLGEKGCYFEPVHGSAPRLKPNCANPSAMFLTIGLLLEHFGYSVESTRIKNAVKEIIKRRIHITYDLGGTSSTKDMASAIIDQVISPQTLKTISFLATGSEIINGDIQDTNGNAFAKSVIEKGGNVYQHIQVSDKQYEISSALKYLLNFSDAIVVTGGLGPTSDDTTRYAIANLTKSQLNFDEDAWSHVVKRLESYNLKATDSNRQQALFPAGACLYPNENGTAYGAYLKWQDKHIFMLPGPPKECCPMFEKFVLPAMKESNFFRNKRMYRWLTLGLIEGEIGPVIDSIVKPYAFEVGYRWNYPYIEIKLIADGETDIQQVLNNINDVIGLNLVSDDGMNAFHKLNMTLGSCSRKIQIIDNVTLSEIQKYYSHENMIFIAPISQNRTGIVFEIKSSIPLHNQIEYSGSITFECTGYIDNQIKYQHSINAPNRNEEIFDFAKEYFAWQCHKFITNVVKQS